MRTVNLRTAPPRPFTTVPHTAWRPDRQVTTAEANNGEGTLPLAISNNPEKLLVTWMDPAAGRSRTVPVTGLVLRAVQHSK
jgi:hypothetical protein